MPRSRIAIALTLAALLVGDPSAWAGPDSEIASAFDEGDAFDLHTSIHYRFSTRSAGIKRELAGLDGTDPDGRVSIGRDLKYKSVRHLLVPRLELGIFTDLALSVELPIVLRDTRELSLDTGVDRGNSTTIGDGLLSETGFDARDPTGPGFASGDLLFRGVDRSGLDQIVGGVTWAPMNQVRDATKPTWKIGAEVMVAIGKAAAFDRADPDSEKGVGRGVDEVRLWTSIARRRGWAEPFFELWWKAAFVRREKGSLDPLDREFGAAITAPQQQGGARIGFQAIFFERKADKQRVSLDLESEFVAHFEGREYTEMWEVFAFAGDSTSDGPLILDADPLIGGVQPLSHPGVTNVQNYLSMNSSAAIRAEIGPKVRIGALFGLTLDQAHFISFADAGEDLPTCGAGETTNCETDINDVVNPMTREVNPLHAGTIDDVGHRYKVNEARTLSFMVEARFLF